jgi:hypothetical protein
MGIDGNRRISQVLACAVVGMGRAAQTGDGRQDKSGDCRRAHVVGGTEVFGCSCEQSAGAPKAKFNHFKARSAVAALGRHWSYL